MNTSTLELHVSRWFNTQAPLTLEQLRAGRRVVVLLTFQMLCPGCVATALPQVQRVHAGFSDEDVAVVGLHTVFEHHEAMTPVALEAFLHEYRIRFPVGVDEPSGSGPLPKTMASCRCRGRQTC